MEGFRLLEVLYDDWRGAPQRGFRGLGGAYALIRALEHPTPPRGWPKEASYTAFGPNTFLICSTRRSDSRWRALAEVLRGFSLLFGVLE
jgi:hypothetical protein